MRFWIVYPLLRLLRAFARVFYTIDVKWVRDAPDQRWVDFHLVAILNHTSLFECLLAGTVTPEFLSRMARRGVVPIASKTIERPLVGRFWKMIAGEVVSISRERDHTWEAVLESVKGDKQVMLLPEGHMKRRNGLDSKGRPMTVRGGIADLMVAIGEGPMLLAYSHGLHHIQAPGEGLPKLFKTISLRLERIQIEDYIVSLGVDPQDERAFRRAVVADLTARRDRYCRPDSDDGSEKVDDGRWSGPD
ncbi:MAG: hypothetical protein AAF772_21570 [Acidobacteriota bacterium]